MPYSRTTVIASTILLGIAGMGCNVPDSKRPAVKLGSQSTVAGSCAPLYVTSGENQHFLDDLEHRIFQYFWNDVFPETGISWDHSENPRGKVAATGFQLAAVCIGVKRGWITYEQGYERTLQVLNTFHDDPTDPNDVAVDGQFGLFWHFVDGRTGKLDPADCVAMCDSADLLAGVVLAAEFFKDTPAGDLAQEVYDRAQWDKFVTRKSDGSPGLLSFGWVPLHVSENYHDTEGLIPFNMAGFVDNSLLVYALALGSDTHPIPHETWDEYINTFTMSEYAGYEAVMTGSGALFSRQVPHSFIRFSRKRDRKLDYFLEMVNKLLADRAFNMKVNGYPPELWGLTDCFGKNSYSHGAPPGQVHNDGTIATTAFVCGLPYTPGPAFDAIWYVMTQFGDRAYGKYGFTSSVNPKNDHVSSYVVGIEAGPMLLMIENYRTGLIWDLFSQSRVMKNFIKRARMSGIVDDFELPPEAAAYAQWSVEGGEGRLANTDSQYGHKHFEIRPDKDSVRISGRLTENDLLHFHYSKYLSFWARDMEPVSCEVFIDGREIPLTLAGQASGQNWQHFYFKMPSVNGKSALAAVNLEARIRGSRPALDNITLEAEADLGAPEIITDLTSQPGRLGGTVQLQWTAPSDTGSDRVDHYLAKISSAPNSLDVRYTELPVVKEVGVESQTLALGSSGGSYVSLAAVDEHKHLGPFTHPISVFPNPTPMNPIAYDFHDESAAGWASSTTNIVLRIVHTEGDDRHLRVDYDKDHAWNYIAIAVDPDMLSLHRYLTVKVRGHIEILGKLWCAAGLEQDMESLRSESGDAWTVLKFDTRKADAISPRRNPVKKLLLFPGPGEWSSKGTFFIDSIAYSDF